MSCRNNGNIQNTHFFHWNRHQQCELAYAMSYATQQRVRTRWSRGVKESRRPLARSSSRSLLWFFHRGRETKAVCVCVCVCVCDIQTFAVRQLVALATTLSASFHPSGLTSNPRRSAVRDAWRMKTSATTEAHLCRTQVSNTRPGGRIQPATSFYVALDALKRQTITFFFKRIWKNILCFYFEGFKLNRFML